MQLFYYRRRDQQPNFGDELNRWLWQQALPDLLQAQSDTALVGIGTLLNSALPQRLEQFRQVRIFSTGAGYEKPLAQVPANWKIYALRGPLSARQLGLPASLALSDGGILLRRWYQLQARSSGALPSCPMCIMLALLPTTGSSFALSLALATLIRAGLWIRYSLPSVKLRY
ncbi:MAG: hypothetical protein HC873_11815 [Leptolyngbyaceae cyanobacterium SL_1_1]|nr:hypothetical protein [Leptolyngbyaceae cyanobacterium SL_1_1]